MSDRARVRRMADELATSAEGRDAMLRALSTWCAQGGLEVHADDFKRFRPRARRTDNPQFGAEE